MKPYYEKDGITLYHGDCREILPSIGPADLVLTDPPYGIGEARGKNASRTNITKARDYGVSSWDDRPIGAELMRSVIEAGRYAIVFGGNFYSMAPSSCWLVWDKDNTGDFADCELAWTNMPRAVRKFKWRWNGMLQEPGHPKEKRVHPTQKPIALMRWCIELSKTTGTILDPFAGSGTTLRAAKDLGRQAIGVEIEERYCEVAANRLRQGVLPFQESSAAS